jgi:NTE family protein
MDPPDRGRERGRGVAKVKVAIACQGGGSQTAFTAGALKGLVEHWQPEEFDCVSISGTSGGAVCAALVWQSLIRNETPLWSSLMDFWAENTAQGWAEETFNATVLQSLRLVNSGMLPAYQFSPSSPVMQFAMSAYALGCRPTFTDFPLLLRKYFDFAALDALGARPEPPVLVIGAANVSTGRMVKFSSRREPIRIEHLLASCAVPSIFPAVQLGAEAYWDGLFSDNPPVEDLIQPAVVGADNIPDEIWLIKINPTESAEIPVQIDHILDRRNQIEGNISLFHQLDHLEFVNRLIVSDAFRPEYLERFDIQAPIRIPRAFEDAPERPYHIPMIEMPKRLQSRMDYEGKIDRSKANIGWLVEQGERQAKAFLAERARRVAENPLTGPLRAMG